MKREVDPIVYALAKLKAIGSSVLFLIWKIGIVLAIVRSDYFMILVSFILSYLSLYGTIINLKGE